MTRLSCAIGVVVLAACSRTQESPERIADSAATPAAPAKAESLPSLASSPDSMRGELELVSNEPVAEVIMRTGDSVLVLRGADLESLRRVAGLEVVVRGRRTNERVTTASPRGSAVFDVASFAVRAANGEPAVDGILEVENGQFYLRSGDGTRTAIARIPSPLRGEIGSRIYLVGPLSGAVTAFGVVAEGR